MLIIALSFLVMLLAVAILLWPPPNKNLKNNTDNQAANQSESTPVPAGPKQLQSFSADQFKDLLNDYSYPNTTPIAETPSITGNSVADARIRNIAEKRGYMVRTLANNDALVTIEGQKMQAVTIDSYNQLKAAAAAANLDINIVSGFRNVAEQRNIFLGQMRAKNISATSIANGQSDAQVDAILKLNSIPGYSRHHNGYTVDFQCAESGLDNFAKTPCYAWLNANNYERVKMYGFIPSYPDGATNQGPNPEQWEYVWVGTDALYK